MHPGIPAKARRRPSLVLIHTAPQTDIVTAVLSAEHVAEWLGSKRIFKPSSWASAASGTVGTVLWVCPMLLHHELYLAVFDATAR